MKTQTLLMILFMALTTPAFASDHDDGEIDLKGRSLNITDVYAFREDNQTGNAADAQNLILIMNTNPRSLPGQQYFFSTQALYQFHLTRVTAADKTKKPTGKADVVFRVEFANPTPDGRQTFTVTMINNGQESRAAQTTSGNALVTTPLQTSKSGSVISNAFTLGGQTLTAFAGLREDPFFFDVEQFFKVREHALKTRSFLGFLPTNTAKDFTHNYNVNSIVMRIPIALLQSGSGEPVFDVWTTILVPSGS